MNKTLERNFRRWLSRLAEEWDLSIEEAAQQVGGPEVDNRRRHYPKVGAVLATSRVSLTEFAEAAHPCWVVWGRFDATRFNEFVKQDAAATQAIQRLIDNFPQKESKAAERIDDFIEEIANFGGYLAPRGPDRAGAAVLASLILTCLRPARFVDYRRKRWEALAETFQYEPIPTDATYGMQLLWAGKFAQEIAATKTYQLYWPKDDTPLWTIAGICWDGPEPERPAPDPIDFEEVSHFPEGDIKRRPHLVRERSQAVVVQAKGLALQRDALLRCEICGFSFVEAYGELGSEFVEAHHKIPLAELKPNSKTKVEDLAMVCANCHRILHRGERMLSIDELRAIVQSQRTNR